MESDFPGWHRSKHSPNFCIYANDWAGVEGRVLFLTDPSQAYAYWSKHGFHEMVEWAEEGFDGIKQSEKSPEAFWILSPDIGKGG